MTPIENTRLLRSAFLKIGWAPLVCIIGAVLVVIYATVSIVGNHYDSDHLLVSMKSVFIFSSIVSLAGYLLSYLGFAQAHKAFGQVKAGASFSALKIIFLIYCIIGALMLIVTCCVPSSVDSYTNMAGNLTANARMASAGGIIIVFVYIIIEVYSIISLFIIKSCSAALARTTNIVSFKSVATGAQYGVYSFFMSLVVILFSITVNSDALVSVLSLALLGLAIFALVKWTGGWLGAASEVLRHPVEAEDYNDTPLQ